VDNYPQQDPRPLPGRFGAVRSDRRQLKPIPDLSSDPAPPGDEASESYLRDQAREMARAHFDDRTWQAFWRAGVQGNKPADVAEDLEMSVGAVYMAKNLSENRRGLAHFAESSEQNVPVPILFGTIFASRD